MIISWVACHGLILVGAACVVWGIIEMIKGR